MSSPTNVKTDGSYSNEKGNDAVITVIQKAIPHRKCTKLVTVKSEPAGVFTKYQSYFK